MQNKVTKEQIDKIMNEAEFDVKTIFNKCTVVTAKLANGFIIVESSACVDPANYDASLGKEICMKRIEDKIWGMEGYKLQCELSEADDRKIIE
ncbi:Gp49 family protein [Bacillus sp. Hm123]|uniref:Gp49 family protein n=1 Tax=Bacillus sp. Hm123 TaxID=3450745 RepID=UPI003F41CB79